MSRGRNPRENEPEKVFEGKSPPEKSTPDPGDGETETGVSRAGVNRRRSFTLPFRDIG